LRLPGMTIDLELSEEIDPEDDADLDPGKMR
jgi:hypothetical protein